MKIINIIFFSIFCNVAVAKVFITDSGYIEYIGEINEINNNLVKSLYEINALKPKRLVITSPGGNVNYGIELGEWVYDNGLDVEVGEYCISSCANYVFLSGNNKFLRKNSILGWHGGLLQLSELPFKDKLYLKDVLELTEKCDFYHFEKNYKNKLAFPLSHYHMRECHLMKKLGIDYRIMILGQYYGFYSKLSNVKFWSYELETLRFLGVENINLINSEWRPPKYINEHSVLYLNNESIISTYIYSNDIRSRFRL